MPIILVRIDDRLIHGQIVEGWLKIINVNHIVIVSDEVANDKMQKVLLSMAVPSGIKVSSFSIDETVKSNEKGLFTNDRIIMIISRPQDALRLIQGGLKLSSINVGGMHYAQGKKQLLRNLSVDESDIISLQDISEFGVELEGRVLPSDERVNVITVLNREMKNLKF